jgi:hypothetical protein
MKEKIKKIFEWLGHAWSGGIKGKAGIALTLFAGFMFLRIFVGAVTPQRFVLNIWTLNAEQQQLALEREALDRLEHHIHLMQVGSPDFVEEMGLRHLNIGDRRVRILRI